MTIENRALIFLILAITNCSTSWAHNANKSPSTRILKKLQKAGTEKTKQLVRTLKDKPSVLVIPIYTACVFIYPIHQCISDYLKQKIESAQAEREYVRLSSQRLKLYQETSTDINAAQQELKKTEPNQDILKKGECNICLDIIIDPTITLLPCGHCKYHTKCILNSDTCPECRGPKALYREVNI